MTERTNVQPRGIGGINHRAAAWLAWSVCAVSLSLFALTFLMSFVGWATSLPALWYSWSSNAVEALGYVGAPLLGGLVASRLPRNPFGWLWLGFGLSVAILTFGGTYAAFTLTTRSDLLPAPLLTRAVGDTVGFVGAVATLPLLLLLFPDGRLPSRRWRFPAWVIVSVAAVLGIAAPFQNDRSEYAPYTDPLAVGDGVFEGAIDVIVIAGVLILFGAIGISALSLVFRYRGATGVERQQIKWFAFAATLLSGYLVLTFLPLSVLLNDLLGSIAFTGLCAALGVAIFRHRLYDIDVIINRTLVYGLLTAILAGIYFGSVTATQNLFRTLTDQEQLPQLVVVASTLVIAALFNPLRRRIQAFIDRRFYRRKYDARKTLEDFSATLRDETDLDALNDDLVSVVRDTMQPAHVSLWLRPDAASQRQRPG